MVAAVVFDPAKDELFIAEKGDGAFVNDKRLRVSGRRDMNSAIFATGVPFGGRGTLPATLKDLGRLMPVCAGVRRWGSAALDLLLMRGEAALDAGDIEAAIGHLTALTDHAPDFAAGWTARANAFAMAGQTGPAVADLSRALQLEPRDWNALKLLGALLEESGDPGRAKAAYQASLTINPHQQDAADALARLSAADLGQDA